MRIRNLILVVTVLAVFAGACARDDRSLLAVASGEEISLEQFEAALSASRVVNNTPPALVRFDNTEGARTITNLIQYAVVREGLVEYDIELPQLVGGGDANELSIIQAVLAQLSDELIGVESSDDEDRIIAALLGEVEPLDRATCASHILVPDLDVANSVLDRLAGGETFEDLAVELSVDPGSGAAGGVLGCGAPSGYIPEFANVLVELSVDEISDPVESTFGFHIIKRTADTSEVRQTVLGEARASAISEWLTETFAVAVVEVDPAFGTWTGTVVRSDENG